MRKPEIIEILLREGIPLKKAGRVFKCKCVFHEEKTPSLIVDPDKQRFRCFGCSSQGDVIDFIQLYHNISYPDALNRLLIRDNTPAYSKTREKQKDLLERFKRWEKECLTRLCKESIIINLKLKTIKEVSEMLFYADLYHRLEILEYYIDILSFQGNKEKLEMYRCLNG